MACLAHPGLLTWSPLLQIFADNTDTPFEHQRADAPQLLAVQQHPYSDEIDDALEAAIAQQGFRWVGFQSCVLQESKLGSRRPLSLEAFFSG